MHRSALNVLTALSLLLCVAIVTLVGAGVLHLRVLAATASGGRIRVHQ